MFYLCCLLFFFFFSGETLPQDLSTLLDAASTLAVRQVAAAQQFCDAEDAEQTTSFAIQGLAAPPWVDFPRDQRSIVDRYDD